MFLSGPNCRASFWALAPVRPVGARSPVDTWLGPGPPGTNGGLSGQLESEGDQHPFPEFPCTPASKDFTVGPGVSCHRGGSLSRTPFTLLRIVWLEHSLCSPGVCCFNPPKRKVVLLSTPSRRELSGCVKTPRSTFYTLVAPREHTDAYGLALGRKTLA